VRNIEYTREDRAKDEQVQESKGEDFGLDTNTLQDSNKRLHLVKGSFCWLNI
jgi:hypothetical protein